jgi:hypothetical protein
LCKYLFLRSSYRYGTGISHGTAAILILKAVFHQDRITLVETSSGGIVDEDQRGGIYSQLKRCSSSEVAAMIEGVLRHCTEMEVEKQYTDSHGQSEVAFAFCRMLGFELLPRLKAIHSQRLYRPDNSVPYPKFAPILSRTINWALIAQQYDRMVKYATALRLGTADTEDILRRFRRSNVKHPVYQAVCLLCQPASLPVLINGSGGPAWSPCPLRRSTSSSRPSARWWAKQARRHDWAGGSGQPDRHICSFDRYVA